MLLTVFDILFHPFEDAFLGLFYGDTLTVNARKVFAVGVISLTFSFDGDGIGVEGHTLFMLA